MPLGSSVGRAGRAGVEAWTKHEGGKGAKSGLSLSILTLQPQPTVHMGTRGAETVGQSSEEAGVAFRVGG